MAIRNRIIRLFGRKDLSVMQAAARASDTDQVGDRFGIFSILACAAGRRR